MSCGVLSLFTNVTVDPTGTVMLRGLAPLDVIVIVVPPVVVPPVVVPPVVVVGDPPEGPEGELPPHAATHAATPRVATNTPGFILYCLVSLPRISPPAFTEL